MYTHTYTYTYLCTHFYIVNYQYILKLMSSHYLLKFQSNTFNSNATFYLFLFPYFIQNLAPIFHNTIPPICSVLGCTKNFRIASTCLCKTGV